MKNILFIAIVAIMSIFSSCQKDEITVNLKTSGSLSVQLIDSTEKTYPKVKVHLYTSYSMYNSSISYGGEIDVFSTDDKGNVDFGTVAAGTYYVVADTIQNASKKYVVAKVVQVVSGDSKKVVLNPLEYVGNIKLTLNLYTSGISVDTVKRSNIRVALINSNDYVSKMTRSQILNKAIDVKAFNENGSVSFNKVPANISYLAYVYYNNSDTTSGTILYNNNSYSVVKDGNTSSTVSVNLSDIYIIRANMSLKIQYYGNNGTTGVPKANAILVSSTDYNSYDLNYSSLSTIKKYAVATGVTDSNGNITFSKIPVNNSYRVYIYYDATKAVWNNNSISPSDYSNTISVYGSYLGLNK